MSTKKKKYSAQLKAKIAIEAVRAEKSVSELSGQYEIHPTVINKWKRKLLEEARKNIRRRESGKKRKRR